jgi:hypothetical protein
MRRFVGEALRDDAAILFNHGYEIIAARKKVSGLGI